MGSELSIEERNLLSVAFKNAVGACRQAWRSIAGMQRTEENSEKTFAIEFFIIFRNIK